MDQMTVFDQKSPHVKMWFEKNPDIDEKIRKEFRGDLLKALNGELTHWEKTPRGRLALVILLDQFTRNIYRDQAEAFCGDEKALNLCMDTIDDKLDENLYVMERIFLYMPLMHSEQLEIQEKSLKMFKNLIELAKIKSPQNKMYCTNSYKYSQLHYDIIKKFGRFPHRNKILNRPSTPEEIEFLKKPGSSF
jgi:uncharacterized protein (DUF924 family)